MLIPDRLKLPALAVTACAAVTATSCLTGPAAFAAPTSTPPATAAVASTEDQASRFTLGILPDTQFYSRYATPETGDLFEARYGSEPFATQTRWLAEHADALNMPFVTHLGDVVDQSGVEDQWTVGSEAMAVLEEAGLPYSVLPGNHDLARGEHQPYLDTFTMERAAKQSTFGGRSPDGLSEYHVFESEGQRYLVLALEYHAGDDTLAWAQEVLDQHPTLPTILTAHENLGLTTDRTAVTDTAYGQHLWETLIAGNDQVFLTLSGHNHGAGVRVKQNDAGNDVVEVLMDYQMAYQGGNGLMGVLEFDLTNNELQLAAFSPWVAVKPAETLTSFDDVTLPQEPHSWTLEFNFADRFAGINPSFTAGTADEEPLADLATTLVTDGYMPYEPGEAAVPSGPEDYPEVQDTVAHWRPGDIEQADGSVLPVGSSIPEVVAGQDFTRQEGINGAEEDDVTLATDSHPLSSDGAAVCFADADKHYGGRDVSRLNYFTTPDDAPVNSKTFEDGYTVETFLYASPTWSAAKNPSMKALGRMGERNNILEGAGLGSPASLAFSNLQELQWSAMATQGNNTGGTSNWSHEIPLGEWVHVAVVNDPADMTLTMYVDGAPILRNVIDVAGLVHDEGKPWMLGAGQWGEVLTDGWNGCIGETRVVSQALDESQWLTARAPQEPAEPAEHGKQLTDFGDNEPGSAFHAPVRWMAENGISVGYTDGTFKKNREVSRGETAAFLHRYLSPGFKAPDASPFNDVNAEGAFFTPIMWAATEQITVGYADGSFRPSTPVTRGQFAAFLYQLADPEHTAPSRSPFSDINVGGANYRAITWLASEGITAGYNDGEFKPSEEISRGEISAFLQRYDRFVAAQ